MVLLDSVTGALEISLPDGPATEIKVYGSYAVFLVVNGARVAKRGVKFAVETTGATPVELMPHPASGKEHELMSFFLVQPNAATTRVLLEAVDGAMRVPVLDHDLDQRDNLRLM